MRIAECRYPPDAPLPRRLRSAGWARFILAALLLCLAAPSRCESPRPEVRELAGLLRAQRSSRPAFAEAFSTDLRQWGVSTPLGPEGMVLAHRGGTVPGAARLFVPGLLLRDGALSCRVRLQAEDEGYLMFRAGDDADAAYQLVLSTRAGFPAAGFAKRHNLDQLYGGARVGRAYDAAARPDTWAEVEVYFQGRVLLALVDGEPAAYYDRADARDGSLSFFCGSRPMALRDLAVTTFHGDEPVSPYGLSRPAPARGFRKPGDEPPLFTNAEGPPLAPRRGWDRAEGEPGVPRWARRPSPPPEPREPTVPKGAEAPFLAGGVMPASPPEVSGDLVGGTYPDLHGGVHVWCLEAEGRFLLDGEELVPLRDTDGLYWAQVPGDVDLQRALRSIADAGVLARVRTHGLPWEPIRVRLVDYINATATDHEFSEDPVLDGRSRVLSIAGRSYRVTSARRWLSYFAYTARTDSPMQPHLLLAEAPNDRERYLTVRVQPPDGSGADPDYGIGTGTYSGRGLPCDNRPFNNAILFTPRSGRVRFTISRMPGEERWDGNNGAAVSQVFLFALLEPPEERPNPVLPALDTDERTLALAVPSARAILRQCGADLDSPGASRAQRAAGYRAFIHHLRFLGFSAVDLGVLDIRDGDLATEFVGSRVLESGVDRGLFSDFLPLAASAGIRVTPVVPPLPLSPRLLARGQNADEWAVLDREGQPGLAGPWPMLDLLHPGAGAMALEWLCDVAGRFMAAGCRDVALRVDGDVGGCLPRAGLMRAEETGYSAADVARFACETGVVVPGETAAERHTWLRSNAWDRWVDWRCRTMQAHWSSARDILRGLHKDSRLILKLAVPDRELARPDAWFEEKRHPHDLLRAHGFDPRAYVDNDTFILERTLDVAYDRVRTCAHRENVAALDSFNYQTTVSDLYKGKAPSAVEVSIAPWGEYGQHLGSEFYPRRGEHWGESTVVPWGRWLFRPLTSALRYSNPYRVSLSGAEFATAGREHDWRRFARAYRALPAVEPAAFEGRASLLPAGSKPGPAAALPGDLLVRAYGLRVGIINDSAQARRIELLPQREPAPGERWVDLATGITLARGGQEPAALVLDVDAFDLRVLALLPDASSPRE